MSNLTNFSLTKIYTKKGDFGTTMLYDQSNLPKSSPIFEALGDLDELSSQIGFLCSVLQDEECVYEYSRKSEIKQLRYIQHKLLDLGSDVATISKREKITEINEEDVSLIEAWTDQYNEKSKKLTEFILQGHGVPDAIANVCRTVSRRAERHLFCCQSLISSKEYVYSYMNRLSSFFFAFARYLSEGNETLKSEAKNLD
jgi:cob(I)alamin adenosyltransferase